MPASRGGFTSRPSGHVSTKAALRAPIAKKSAYTPPSGSTPRVVISTSHSTKEHDARATYGSFRRPSTRSDTKPVSGAEPSSASDGRSEEHTSELQSLAYLVCRLLLEKKKKKQRTHEMTHHERQI